MRTRFPHPAMKSGASMKNPRMRLGVLTALSGSALALTGCPSEAVTCGPGTLLNETTNQCVPSGSGPDFNVVVDDFSLGEFDLTQVDVPEQMVPGFRENRTFTITNTGDEDQDTTLIIVNLVPGVTDIDQLREAIDDVGAEPECSADDECAPGTTCDEEEGYCRIDRRQVAMVVVPNLAAGESREVSYEYSLVGFGPEDEGLYGLLFSVNEYAVVSTEYRNDAGETELNEEGEVIMTYEIDPSQPALPADPLSQAAALAAPATMLVGIPERPNLRLLYADLDNPAFDIDTREAPTMTVSGRMSAQGRDVEEPVRVTFELHLPGHLPEVPGKDLGEDFFDSTEAYEAAPDVTTWKYDEDRVFTLLQDGINGAQTEEHITQGVCVENDAETGACLREIHVKNDEGRDGTFALRLSEDDARLLGMTRYLAEFNPDLNDEGEVQGFVRMNLALTSDEGEYTDADGNEVLADNHIDLDVVFMAPETAETADPENDLPEHLQADTTGDENALYIPTLGYWDHYANRQNLTPIWRWRVGGSWAGAEAQIYNVTSYENRGGYLVAYKLLADDFAALDILTFRQFFVKLLAHADFSSRRRVTENIGTAKLEVFRDWGSTRVLLDERLDTSDCSTEGSFTTCPIIASEYRPDRATLSNFRRGEKRRTKSITINGSKDKRKWFAIGPLPFEVAIGVSWTLGINANLAYVQDGDPVGESSVTTGVQASAGPIANLSGYAFGGLSVWLMRAGIRGNISFVDASFIPTLLVGIQQDWNDGQQCWDANDIVVKIEGPYELKVISGDIRVVVEGCIKLCAPWVGCWEGGCSEIFGFEVARFPPAWKTAGQAFTPYQRTLYSASTCNGAPPPPPPPPARYPNASWSSPTWCWGRYCNYANGTGYYQGWLGQSGSCGNITITGQTERWFDFVEFVREGESAPFWRKSGYMNETFSSCGRVLVRLKSDWSIVYPGVTVRASP